ncbi:DNA gyrase subunit A [Aliidongia dinghuensis]|uniref:DNA gyrase subunit A n=1 Tax=Aliidongia dinghuensis TaxID=1867774 RepID=A0A8J3E4S8_9PROT|nr:DNA gyrase subunit A [Aliidongia dinghuensis]GGF41267.1 DNA gyrase subunit A [Aliidongia dinghuensis]
MVTTPPTPTPFDITPVTIEDEMKRSYLDYAMSVIVSRALPDVRDGLKPVHRRILYAMKETGNEWNRAFRKCARAVGDVMGKYHPHGDSAIYEALARMAQDFSMRLPLIQGQGNFGSMDGDRPAAMRYTESRLARVSEYLLTDIDKNTVDFQPNYDDRTVEPMVLPARFPNILVNGAGGIAVGMATNIPPHNLGEVIDACFAYIENPDVTIDELLQIVPGPDFPTGGLIMGRSGVRAAAQTGRGSVVMRCRHHVEEIRKDREAIIVTEIPYQVNKSRLMERIGEVVREKLVEGIADLRDESDRDGVRMVIEIKRDASPDVVMNQLFRHTPLQTSFGVNALALNRGRPELMTLKDVIRLFVEFREEVITRRTIFELGKARERAHVLVGLAVAVANIDEVIRLIRYARDPAEALEQLTSRAWPAADVAPLIELINEPGRAVGADMTYMLSEPQAKAILDLRLQRLTGLERDKIAAELSEIAGKITELLGILRSKERKYEIMRTELKEVRDQFTTPRRSTIEDVEHETDVEDLIEREDMVVTVSMNGAIKRVPATTYRAQRRGGRGRAGMAIRDEDSVSQLFVASTHTPVLFFTSSGMFYKLKVWRLPVGTPQSRGRAIVNLLPNIQQGETISAILPLPEDESTWGDLTVMFATAKGNVRRNSLADFANVMSNGKIAMKFEGEDADDKLIGVAVCTHDDDVLLATRRGKCIRFQADDVRVFAGRNSVGVRGIKLLGDDAVISMSIIGHVEVETAERDAYLSLANKRRRAAAGEAEADAPEGEGEEGDVAEAAEISEARFAELAAKEQFLLTVSSKGFGVRTSAYRFRITNRGGQGIDNMDVARRGDEVLAVFPVEQNDEIVLVSNEGQVIRCPVHDIRIAARGTQGVVIFRLGENERAVSVACMKDTGEDSETEEGAEGEEAAAPEAPEGDAPTA